MKNKNWTTQDRELVFNGKPLVQISRCEPLHLQPWQTDELLKKLVDLLNEANYTLPSSVDDSEYP